MTVQPPKESLRSRLLTRKRALDAVRGYFDAKGLLEAETPILVPGTGLEPHIDPLHTAVRTDFNAPGRLFYLHTSPEIQLKRMLARGVGPVFQIARVFRDGERTRQHRPEFTLVEWYRPGGTMADLRADCLGVLRAVADALDLSPSFLNGVPPLLTVSELFAAHDIDLEAALSAGPDGLVEAVRAQGSFHLRTGADFDDAFFAVMARVEEGFAPDRCTFVHRYCAQHAALARLCDDDARFAERFEMYVGPRELANAFDELTDADAQRARFENDNDIRRSLGKAPLAIDEAFLAELGDMPQTVGIAMGFERLLMSVLGTEDIGDVMFGLDD